MKDYSEHMDAIRYVKESVENEISWVKSIFFRDILEEVSNKDVVNKYKLPLIAIWYKEVGHELPKDTIMKKTDVAIWDLNAMDEITDEQRNKIILDAAVITKCPKEIVLAIVEIMDLVYQFCGKRKYDSRDVDNIRTYCNLYMADHVHKTSELFNIMIAPINEVLEQAKNDLKNNK